MCWTWPIFDEPRRFCIPLVWLGIPVGGVLTADPKNAEADAETVKAVPAGRRAVILQHLGESVINDPADRVMYQGNPYNGLWLNNGTANTARMFRAYLQAFKAAGGTIDYLAMDDEAIFNIWGNNAQQLLAWMNDPRYKAAVSAGQAPAMTGVDANGKPIVSDYSLFNQYATRINAIALQAAIGNPLLEAFPQAGCSNYANAASNGSIPDANGFAQKYHYQRIGTAQSPCFYSAGSNADAPFAAMVYGINRLRMSSILCRDPIIPWLGDPGADWTKVLTGTSYYAEMLYHAMLCCGTRILFFNPWALAADIATLDDAMSIVYAQAHGNPWGMSMTGNYLLAKNSTAISGARFGTGLAVWRITFAPGQTSTTFFGKTVVPDASGVGAWVVE